MKRIKAFFGKFAEALWQAAPMGTLMGVIMFYIIAVGFIIYSDDSTGVYLIAALLVLNVIGIIGAFVLRLSENFHKFDNDLIGKNFVGISKKCRLFSRSLELLFSHEHNTALEGFKLLESEYAKKLSQEEKAIVSFYIARCYDLMTYYPNAVIYYDKAGSQGFTDPLLPFLKARCTGNNGDTETAEKLYADILADEKNPLSKYVLTDLGRLYLRRDEPEKAMKWYGEAIEKRQNYAEALGGAAIAQTMLHNINEGQRLYREALVNRINDAQDYMEYFKQVLSAVMLEKETEQKQD